MKKKGTWKLVAVLGVLLVAAIYYYLALPAINLHSADMWMFIMMMIVVVAAAYIWKKKPTRDEAKKSMPLKVILGSLVVVAVIYLVGSLLSSPIINAKKYQELLAVEEGDFAADVEQRSFDQIPLLDRDSAMILGNRKMGSMVDMVSQYLNTGFSFFRIIAISIPRFPNPLSKF